MLRVARLLSVLAVALVPAAGAASPAQVAFKQFPGDRQAIVRVDADGSGALELTAGKPTPSEFGAFSWSPDGSRLVYASDPYSANGELYTLSADGTDLVRLTFNGGNDEPAWSPDGGRIAFVRTIDYLHKDIWLVAPDGSNPHLLTTDAGEKFAPAWSPNGSRLLYARLSPTSFQVFVVDAGTGQVLLRTPGTGGTWSPDGSHIALTNAGRIDVVNADGTGRHTVATEGAGAPQWSPDGSQIAFYRTHCTAGVKGLCGAILGAVFVVGADGSGERRLTGPIGGGPGSTLEGFPYDYSYEPSWWPDGSRLFFRSESFPRVMNADGTCEQRFGPPALILRTPAWRPGSMPSLPPLTCAELRVRTPFGRRNLPRRGEVSLPITVENDGNETATGVKLTLRLRSGRSRVELPLPSCRRVSVIECELPPLAPGGATRLLVRVANLKPWGFQLETKVSAGEPDPDLENNVAIAYAEILDCDIVGTIHGDRLVGTRGRDKICGRDGNDKIRPRAGRDVVLADRGRDRIFARDGQRDVIDCGPGHDTVFADRIDRVASNCNRVHRH